SLPGKGTLHVVPAAGRWAYPAARRKRRPAPTQGVPMNRLNTAALASLALLLAACGGDPRTPVPSAEGAPAADPADNSRNSLDWAGTYRGVLPCADCEGIETVITLAEDGSFREHTRYLGRQDAPGASSRQGSFD